MDLAYDMTDYTIGSLVQLEEGSISLSAGNITPESGDYGIIYNFDPSGAACIVLFLKTQNTWLVPIPALKLCSWYDSIVSNVF